MEFGAMEKKLKEKLHDYPIEFVYITIDDYSNKLWKEAFELSKEKENHYRFAHGFHSRLHDAFSIMAIPSYILIDKHGNLISYKAERPFNNQWQPNAKLEKELIHLAS